jgi:YVTN family beta-propeller protein
VRVLSLSAGILWISCQATTGAGSANAVQGAPSGASEHRGPLVYVSNEESTEISVIDATSDTLLTSIFVGKRPRGIKVSPDGKKLFVALSGSPMAPPGTDESKLPPPDRSADGIAIVDLATQKLERTLSTGDDPESFDISADGKTLYVSNEDAGTATVVSLPSGQVIAVVPVGGEPEGVRLRPDGKVVYVTSEEENEVAVIDTATNKVIAKIETGARPRGIAFTADSSRAYVTAEQGGSVAVIDAKKHALVSEIKVESPGAKPMGVVLSPSGDTAYVSCGRGGVIAVIDVATNRVSRILPGIGTRPWGIGVTPDGRKLYTANGPSNDVSVVDVSTGVVSKRISAGKGPWGIALVR